MGGFMLMGLLAPAFFLLMIAWAISTIVIAVTLPKKAVKAPACERCKYPVAGLAAFNCPECGTDLRVTGIITRTMEVRRRGNLFSAIIAWTVLCGIAGLIASSIFGSMWMVQTMYSAANSTTTTTTTTFTPNSGTYRSIDVKSVFVTPLMTPTKVGTTITATLHAKDGNDFTAKTTPPGVTWTWTKADRSEASAATIDETAILEWYSIVGVPPGPSANDEAADLASCIFTLSTPGTGITNTKSFQVAATPPVTIAPAMAKFGPNDTYVWTAISLALVGLLAWGAGIWLIINRRKRMLRANTA